MKTPWNRLLLQHGEAVAAIVVITAAGALLLTVVGIAILITKILFIIR